MHRPPHPLFAAHVNSQRTLGRLFAAVILAGILAGFFAGLPAAAADQVDHPALQPFDLQGKKLPHDLFLVRTRGELPDVDGITVYGVHQGVFLVSGDPEAVQVLARKGCAVLRADDLPEPPPYVERRWTRIDTPDPDIAGMVAQVNWTGVLEKIQWLVDFGTRYSEAPNHAEVAGAIRDKFDSYGLDTTMWPFNFFGSDMWNVVATQVGTKYPNSYVIICGHFDSISEDPMVSAPGADDNATGAAAVLTAAEILSRHNFDYSIRYICFGGEEQGLVGSSFYASWARSANLDIVGVLNFDMLGYWEPGVEKDLEIETNQASMWMAEAVLNAADLYTDAEYELHVYDWAWWGDHFFFWLMGYPGVNHEESWDWYDPDFNPHYHSTTDLPEYVDPDFTVDNIKVGVASLATLANAGSPRAVPFDMVPASCPNPFNPKSQGVTNTLLLGSAELDVHGVIPESIRLEGWASPTKTRIADMGSASHDNGHPCADMSPDGFDDLSMKFVTQDIAAVLGSAEMGDAVPVHLTARLRDGTLIEGEDVVTIVGNTGEYQTAKSPDPPLTLNPSAGAPKAFALHQNHPNPFNPSTIIRFDVPAGGGAVTLRVYDVTGRLVRTLVDGMQTPGEKTAVWDGRNDAGVSVASGAYLYRLTGPGFEQTRKMLFLK